MKCRHIFFLTVLMLMVAGCNSRSRALDIAREVGVPKLRSDLQLLVASPAGKQHEIAESAWPDSVQRFRPLAVQLHMTGVLIVFNRSDRKREGLLVMLDQNDDPGGGGSGVSYKSLGHGLFWCSEKLRTVVDIPLNQRTNR